MSDEEFFEDNEDIEQRQDQVDGLNFDSNQTTSGTAQSKIRDMLSLMFSSNANTEGRSGSSTTNQNNNAQCSHSDGSHQRANTVVSLALEQITQAFVAAMEPIQNQLHELEAKTDFLLKNRVPATNPPTTTQPTTNATMTSISQALGSIRITSVTSSIPVPKYDARKTHAQAYLNDVERYFRAQNHTDDQFIYLIKSILPANIKAWWEHVGNKVTSWGQFKAMFIARNDSWEERNQRLTYF